VGTDPESFTPRLRALASEVDPAAIISNPLPLDEVRSGDANLLPWIMRGAVALTGILLGLAISGIYALMSFTVAERTREIGIRTALGAQRNSVLFTVAKRSLAQLGIGILVGIPVAAWLLSQFESVGRIPADSPFVIAFILGACVMVLIGMLACTAPALRALRIMPTEALRGGG
jgi:ABC-type antimicrobial peptide transport system permease subunit